MLEQGPIEQKIISVCMREGAPLPKKIENAPELQMGLELYFGAFLELNSCRSFGMDQGPIPWTAIHQYCEYHNIDGDQREDMFYHVRALDNAYAKHLESKHARS